MVNTRNNPAQSIYVQAEEDMKHMQNAAFHEKNLPAAAFSGFIDKLTNLWNVVQTNSEDNDLDRETRRELDVLFVELVGSYQAAIQKADERGLERLANLARAAEATIAANTAAAAIAAAQVQVPNLMQSSDLTAPNQGQPEASVNSGSVSTEDSDQSSNQTTGPATTPAINAMAQANQPGQLFIQSAPPTGQMPKYSGKIKDYLLFKSSFEHWLKAKRVNLEVDRFQLLLSCLRDDDKSFISGVEMNHPTCYTEAMKQLDDMCYSPKEARKELLSELDAIKAPKSIKDLAGLRMLFEKATSVVNALKLWEANEQYFEIIVLPKLQAKIPDWMELHLPDDLSLEHLLEFVRKLYFKQRTKISEFETDSQSAKGNPDKSSRQSSNVKNGQSCNTVSTDLPAEAKPRHGKPRFKQNKSWKQADQRDCPLECGKKHRPGDCPHYTDASAKVNRLRKLNRCSFCYSDKHQTNCDAILHCKHCQGKHYPTLCLKLRVSSQPTESKTGTRLPASLVCSANSSQIECSDGVGKLEYLRANAAGPISSSNVRVFIDGGSTGIFITRKRATQLGCELVSIPSFGTTVFGGAIGVVIRHKATFSLRSLTMNYERLIEAYVVDCTLPSMPFDLPEEARRVADREGIQFSDELLKDASDTVEILLGNNIIWKVRTFDFVWLSETLLAIKTFYGWCVGGGEKVADRQAFPEELANLIIDSEADSVISQAPTVAQLDSTKADLEALWHMENISDDDLKKSDSVLADFTKQIFFEDNRYTVSLPWKKKPDQLKSNYRGALRCLFALKSRLLKRDLYEQYNSVISEYVLNDFAEPLDSIDPDVGFFLPHHAVVNPEKETTKVRIVFNASAKEAHSSSLNDLLSKGVDLNPLILELLVHFRLNTVAMIADIEKAFLQIGIVPEERRYLKYLWFDNTGQIKAFQMSVVLFGASCSPFILAAVIRFHLSNHAVQYPLASENQDKFYVDDGILGADCAKQAQEIKTQLTDAFASCGMNIRKWRCSNPQLDLAWAGATAPHTTSVLGINWNTRQDKISLANPKKAKSHNTKRSLLSKLASFYDPLGLLAPLTILAKKAIQNLHKNSFSWDTVLTDSALEEADKAISGLEGAQGIQLNRLVANGKNSLTLAIYCDASPIAYGVTVHVMTKDNRNASLLMAKSKLAPIKELSIPQLELAAAAYAVQVWNKIKSWLDIKEVRFFSDSNITLRRLLNGPEGHTVYVRHRIDIILKHTQVDQWFHVPSKLNPADLLTRGCTASELQSSDLWWNGPQSYWTKAVHHVAMSVVLSPDSQQPTEQQLTIANLPLSGSSEPTGSAAHHLPFAKIHKYNVFLVALKFICSVRKRKLTPSESESQSIRYQQALSFSTEIKQLQKATGPSATCRIGSYYAFLDSDGFLRVKTRFITKEPAMDSPILLNASLELTHRWLEHWHYRKSHVSIAVMSGFIRQQYLVLNLRKSLRRIRRTCETCQIVYGAPPRPDTGPLPDFRLSTGKPFDCVGVDLFGPYQIHERSKNRTYPIYGFIMTCAVTRAIRLETVDSLDAEDTHLALQRLFNNNCKPSVVYSDNGTGFRKVASDLKQLSDNIRKASERQGSIVSEPVWKFSSPLSPWQGGFFERLIGCVKRTLHVTLKDRVLPRRYFLTLLSEAEAIVNSRPLFVSPEGEDEPSVTPSHFIFGRQTLALPSPTLGVSNYDRRTLERFKELEQAKDHFWKRYQREYLTTYRGRWWQPGSANQLQLGQRVQVQMAGLKKRNWPIGRVIELLPGRDGVIRNVRVSAQGTEYRRSIQGICPLECDLGPDVDFPPAQDVAGSD